MSGKDDTKRRRKEDRDSSATRPASAPTTDLPHKPSKSHEPTPKPTPTTSSSSSRPLLKLGKSSTPLMKPAVRNAPITASAASVTGGAKEERRDGDGGGSGWRGRGGGGERGRGGFGRGGFGGGNRGRGGFGGDRGRGRPPHTSLSSLPSHPFPTDYCDHFETSNLAISDIAPLLSALARSLKTEDKSLKIYDPFYCTGAVVNHFRSLGFHSVYNRCEDFYQVVKDGKVPEHHILVTNPPFSEEHKTKTLQFCANLGPKKPWMLLLPSYVALKAYYQEAVKNRDIFFITPKHTYEFQHPEGTGHETSPFFSVWFVHTGGLISADAAARIIAESGGGCHVVKSVDGLKQEGIVAAHRRLNPKQRKRLAKKMGGE